ncbi:hypothetical protein FXO38_26143 [Capsicum annuum]|nr:hypothetical protein FXO38_26143 [Capsicum annuum]KAF3638089.1 hypothetical protein FXO37_24547 [Capsicum annuum]
MKGRPYWKKRSPKIVRKQLRTLERDVRGDADLRLPVARGSAELSENLNMLLIIIGLNWFMPCTVRDACVIWNFEKIGKTIKKNWIWHLESIFWYIWEETASLPRKENVQLVLDIASEIPDHESLVQKHFLALLSSVWKVRKSHTNAFSSSQNGLYHSGSLFTPIVNSVSTNYSMVPPAKRFSNLSVCAKLVAVALSDQQSAQSDERVSICDQREVASFPAEHLDITLEFGAEKDDKTIPVQYPVTVKIISPESPSSPRITIAEHHHYKSSQIMAENRFWAASNTEGCLDWASLAFPIGDAKSRTPLKSQFLGKHKPTDSVKVSKSKSRKISTESGDVGLTKDLVLPPMPSVSNDSCPTADMGLIFLTESGNGFEDRTLLDINSVFNASSENVLRHEYVPNFISGLDDWSVFPEFTDIG